jgi:hypothetical protein
MNPLSGAEVGSGKNQRDLTTRGEAQSFESREHG